MVRKKINVVVLMGGRSPEYNVSIASGIQVVKNLSKRKYDVFPIIISPDGKQWHLSSPHPVLALPNPLDPLTTAEDLIPPVRTTLSGLDQLKSPIDVVFIAMHGTYGEDGTVQGMLELAGVNYTGSGVLASAVGMDKLMFRQIMQTNKILVPKFVSIRSKEKLVKITKNLERPPYFVKPNNQGSSVGSSIVNLRKDLKKALNLAWKYSDTALVDEYIKGREFTCVVLDGKKPRALPVIEIISKNEFFDYKAKYQDGEIQEVSPAEIDKKTTKQIQDQAIRVFEILGCRGIARIDFLLKGKKLYVLEINTLPFLGENSAVSKSIKAENISVPQLLDLIIKEALKQ